MLGRGAPAIVVFVALYCGGCSQDKIPTGPSPLPSPSSAIFYTAIGASDTIGFGSSVACLPYEDCPNGRG